MKLGALDTYIEIVREGETGRDEFNAPIRGEVIIATAMSQQVQQTGREYLSADGVQSSRKIVFRTHWLPNIRTTDRILLDDARLSIREVRPLGRRYLEIHAEGAAQ